MKLPARYAKLTQPERRAIREEYARLQGGKCLHCGDSLTIRPAQDMPINWRLFPNGKDFLRHPVHLQHCHKTGLTEGAVHAYCNAVLWQYHGR